MHRTLWKLVVIALMIGCASGGTDSPILRPAEFDRQRLLDAGLPDSLIVRYDSGPILQNPDEIDRALRREYPEDAKRRGESGRIEGLLLVGVDGSVAETTIASASEFEGLNEAAIRVFRQMRFSPALRQGRPVAAWIPMWVTFRVAF